jgi:hypothetical protein
MLGKMVFLRHCFRDREDEARDNRLLSLSLIVPKPLPEADKKIIEEAAAEGHTSIVMYW